MIIENAPQEWKRRIEEISGQVHARSRWRLGILLLGILFAKDRKTVTSWFKAAGIKKGFQEYYYFICVLGQRYIEAIADKLFEIILNVTSWNRKEITAIIDDSPTRRFGPHIEGAGKHHDQTSKPTDQKFLFGHIWVTMSIVINHFQFGLIGLPLLSRLYVREKDIEKLPKSYKWKFKTKLSLAWELVDWLSQKCEKLRKKLWILVDGGYCKDGFLKKLPKEITLVGKLRRDAAIHGLPQPKKPNQRGKPPKYGKRIHLAKRAGQSRGWQSAEVYGKERLFKSFQATYRHAQGPILVVLIYYPNDTWCPYFCTDASEDPIKVIGKIMERCTIEDNFKEIKGTLGAGQQQVRNIWSNIACWHLCLWSYVLAYLWSWRKDASILVDRSNAPWDRLDRRPSLKDRLSALRRCFFENIISDSEAETPKMQKINEAFQALLRRVI
jgi:hypothetical protein